MAQTLTILPALTSPVTVIQSNTLVGDMEALQNLGRTEVLAIAIIGLIYELNAAGGTDYRTNHAQLIRDTTSLFGGISMMGDVDEARNLLLAQSVIDWSDGKTADALLSSSVPALLLEARDLMCYDEETLNRVRILLQYRLAK